MDELIKIINKFDSIETLTTELQASTNITTIEELTEYLESELSYWK